MTMNSPVNSRARWLLWLLVVLFGPAELRPEANDTGNEVKKALGSFLDRALANAAKKESPSPIPSAGGAAGLAGMVPAGPVGLRGEYFDNRDLRGPPKLTRFDPSINFDWGDGSPGAGLPVDNFSVRWTGQILAGFSESYVFTGNRDNGFRLWIDGQLLVDLWNNEWGAYESRPIALQGKRRYEIKIEYYEDWGGAGVSLKWRSPSQPEEIVPGWFLFPPPDSTGGMNEGRGQLDRTQWFATRGSWKDNFGEGKPFDASGIAVASGEWTLNADQTDQVGALHSKPIAVAPGSTVVIRRQVFVHAASRKFEGGLTAFGVADATLSAGKPSMQQCRFSVGYRNFDYETDQNLFTLTEGQVYPPGPGKFAGGTAPTTPPLWDQWFDEEVRYHSGTGETVYLINGQERMRLKARPLDQPYLKLLLHPYGWGTGHFIRMRNFQLIVEPGRAEADTTADLRAQLLRPPHTWADNGSTLGTIVFAADGSAKASWSGDTHYWKLDPPGELVISAIGTTYVTRLKYVPGDGSFTGTRDRTSQVQDGVKAVVRPVGNTLPPGGVADGSGLRGEYFDNPDLRGSPKITRVDYGITHLWGDDSPGPGVPADNFSVRWTGQIQPRYSEAYVLSGYRDDGVRVWIDDRLIIDQWKEGNWAPFASAPVLLTANLRHKIRVEYLELQGQARFDLHWQSQSQREERIPATCLYPASVGQTGDTKPPIDAGTGPGLLGTYFDNRELKGAPKITRVDPTINFDWGNGSPGPGIPDDSFSVRWTGQIQPRFSEAYVLTGNRDNGFRLWVDGQMLVDLWNNETGPYTTRPIPLQANRRYDIKIEYYEDWGGTAVSLKWKSPSQAEEIVPSSALTPSSGSSTGGQTTTNGANASMEVSGVAQSLGKYLRLLASGREAEAYSLATTRLKQASEAEKRLGLEIAKRASAADVSHVRLVNVKPGVTHLIVVMRDAALIAEFHGQLLNSLDWRTNT